ncbi:thioredoxin domain-containing protein [Vibrio sp. CAU 1672]|uniref:DsbA family protein n=1 Tax=Vibrio sp. CAU 1672 TaxID=3032594 RepID=UPI0023D9A875|nr:thioredoxin domain-containing protein [Vibrio sp. CAU 1672]MDF2154569.1 thioredoxin domain-containing protein [Vibrio sp. CAU 1672]
MLKYGIQICASLFILQFITGCQPEQDSKLEAEVASLKQEISQLKEEVAEISLQIKEVNTAAVNARKPKFKTLPNQPDFDDNGQVPSMGGDKAQLAIIEFSDYQCPYCKRYTDLTFPKIKQNYIDSGKVRYLARDFPLKFHPQAKSAAVAANCSFEQGQYWPMRDTFFANVKKLNDDFYQQTATEMSLDMAKFSTCIEDPKMMDRIEKDIELASSLGIRGTPSFIIGRIENNQLINPRLVVGAQDYQVFASLLDELLTKENQE